MTREELTLGMKVRKLSTGGPTGMYVKEPVYTVTLINEYGDAEYTVKGGKLWTCHPSWLVSASTQPGPIAA